MPTCDGHNSNLGGPSLRPNVTFRPSRSQSVCRVCILNLTLPSILHHTLFPLLLLHPLVHPFACSADVASLIEAHGLQLPGSDRLLDLPWHNLDVRRRASRAPPRRCACSVIHCRHLTIHAFSDTSPSYKPCRCLRVRMRHTSPRGCCLARVRSGRFSFVDPRRPPMRASRARRASRAVSSVSRLGAVYVAPRRRSTRSSWSPPHVPASSASPEPCSAGRSVPQMSLVSGALLQDADVGIITTPRPRGRWSPHGVATICGRNRIVRWRRVSHVRPRGNPSAPPRRLDWS